MLAILVQAADAISAARPGARRETYEAYVKRIDDIERIASSFLGVERCYTIEENFEKKNYRASLLKMKELKTPIDNFFDNVLVMDNNVEIRNNRLSILWNIRNLFFKIADFSKIST